MPYKDRERQREAQRQWLTSRRAAWLAGKSCIDCGSTDRLELDHVDRSLKVSHRVWSWAPAKREAELAKCVIRCRACHQDRHAAEMRKEHGLAGYKRGCRCEECRAAKAESNRRYRLSLAARGPDLNRTGVSSFAGKRVATPPPGQMSEPYRQLSFGEIAA